MARFAITSIWPRSSSGRQGKVIPRSERAGVSTSLPGPYIRRIDIYNRKVADEEQGRKNIPAIARTGGDSQGELVNLIRHGAVHFQQEQGVGSSFTPGKSGNGTENFYWVEMKSGRREYSLPDVLEALADVASLIKKHGMAATGEFHIRF